MATIPSWYDFWQLDQTGSTSPTTSAGGYSDLIGDSGSLNLFEMTPQSYLNSLASPYLYSDGGDSGYLDIFGGANALLNERRNPNPNANRPAADLFSLGQGGGPTTRTVEGQGIFTDLDANKVWGGGENYDPSSSVWNGWMSAQDTMQAPTTPTSAGINRVPTDQGDQDFQNALTMADYTGTPLSAEDESAYFQNAKYGT